MMRRQREEKKFQYNLIQIKNFHSSFWKIPHDVIKRKLFSINMTTKLQ